MQQYAPVPTGRGTACRRAPPQSPQAGEAAELHADVPPPAPEALRQYCLLRCPT